MKKRAILAGAIAAAVALVAAGCSGSGSGSSGGGSITYWASNQATCLDKDKQVLHPELEKFTQQTGIKVNLEVIGWNDLQTRIQTAVTSGQAPDVLNIGNTWAASLQATGAFMPFDDAAMNGDRRQGQVRQDRHGHRRRARPGPDLGPALRSRLRPVLQQGRCSPTPASQPPTTWEELVTAAKKLTTGRQVRLRARGRQLHRERHFAFINGQQNGARALRRARQADVHLRRRRRRRSSATST